MRQWGNSSPLRFAPSKELGLTVPWSNAPMSEACHRLGKSFMSTAPGFPSATFWTGGSHNSIVITGSRVSMAAFAASSSSNAPTAFRWPSIKTGAKLRVPKTSNSSVSWIVSSSVVFASHSDEKSLNDTYWPLTKGNAAIPFFFGQSFIKWPDMPQTWHALDSWPSSIRPSGWE